MWHTEAIIEPPTDDVVDEWHDFYQQFLKELYSIGTE